MATTSNIDQRKVGDGRVGLEHIKAAEEAARVQGQVLSKTFEERLKAARAAEAELDKAQTAAKKAKDEAERKVAKDSAAVTAKVSRLTQRLDGLRKIQSKVLQKLAS